MMRRIVTLGIVAAAVAAAKDYDATRYDVRLEVQPDSSLIVTETVLFAFEGGPFTYVYRDLPRRKLDSIEILSASIDGKPHQVEIREGKSVRVTWRFEPTSDSSHMYGLTYRASGVVTSGDELRWNALPTDRDYTIHGGTIDLIYPPAVQLQEPLEARRAASIQEAGPGSWRIHFGRLGGERTVNISARFTEGSLVKQPPAWFAREQERRRQIREALPVGIALFAIALTGGLVLLKKLKGEAVELPETGETRQPPSDLDPALAAMLAGTGGSSGGRLAMATLFDLARRGVVRIEPGEKKWYGSREFWVERQGGGHELRPHERTLIDLLFKDGQRVKLSAFSRNVLRKIKQFMAPVKAQLVQAGLFDPERMAARNRITFVSVVVLIVGSTAAIVALIMAARGGTSDAFALAAGVIGAGVAAVIVGFIGLLAGTAMLQLSPAGAAAAGPWRSFKRGLKTLSKEAESQPSDVFERYLAYAVAFGAGDPWFKAFKKRGNLKIPTWFDAMRASDGHASFAMLMATANSHTYTGGAGASSGGGAAGGGGSGAG